MRSGHTPGNSFDCLAKPVLVNLKVLWRWASDEAAGVDTLGAVAADLHTGVFLLTEATAGFDNPGQLTATGGDPILCGRTTKLQTKRKCKVTPLTIGTWNVRTLQDNPSADQPERRTALVARELTRFNIDIAALCETRLANEGQLTETGAVTNVNLELALRLRIILSPYLPVFPRA
ncbi:Craniofacial development protein 2 [Varanus komodoensis]|nr:Craniofacial development protein 2 [Varanus komodoensis]